MIEKAPCWKQIHKYLDRETWNGIGNTSFGIIGKDNKWIYATYLGSSGELYEPIGCNYNKWQIIGKKVNDRWTISADYNLGLLQTALRENAKNEIEKRFDD